MAGPIRIAILANGSQARGELNKTAAAAEGIGAKFSKFRVPAALALGGLAVGAKKAVNAASDLNEEASKSKVIFGDQAKAIDKFASGAATSLGQSKTAALQAAATFGQIGQKAGLSGKDTADFAKQFSTLSSDLASFNNTSPEEATLAIGAAMRGEAEPLRKYGVLLDDATLRNRALKEGLIDNIKQALTPQQKALAASKEILAQTTKAQGDFARTSDGAANKSRIQAARAANLTAQLGQGLLPAYSALLSVGNNVLGFMSRHESLVKAVVIVVAALAAGVLVASAAQKVYTAGMILFNGTMAVFKGAMVAARTAQLAFNIAVALNPIGVIVVGVIALVAALVLAYKKSDKFRAIVNGAFSAVVTGVKAAVGFVKAKWPLLLAILTGPFGLAVLAIAKNWDKIRDGATATKKWITDKFDAALKALQIVAAKIKSALLAPFQAVRDLIQKILDLISKIKIPKLPDLNPLNGRVSTSGTTGETATEAFANYIDQSVTYVDTAPRTYAITLQVPVGGSLVEAGRQIVAAIDAYETAGGRA